MSNLQKKITIAKIEDWTNKLKNKIITEIEPDYDVINDFIGETIIDTCNSKNSWDIVKILNPMGNFREATDFLSEYQYDFDISDLAIYELEKYVYEKIDVYNLIKEINIADKEEEI